MFSHVVVGEHELMFLTRTSTGPVITPDPPGEVSLAFGLKAMIVLKVVLITCTSAAPKNTCTGAWKASPVIVTRVPPATGPDVGDTARMIGARVGAVNVNAVACET